MRFEHRWRALCSSKGFTLIELLVVILIIAILIAVSAPSFLGQTQKAHDSVSKQYLAVAYKAATAWAVDHTGGDTTADAACASANQGDYCSVAGVVGAINASEPELHAHPGTGPDATGCATDVSGTDPTQIWVEAANAGDIVLCNDPDQRICTLELADRALQPITCADVSGTAPIAEDEPFVNVLGSSAYEVNQTLQTTHADWSPDPTSYHYQWQRCDATGDTPSCVNISGATGQLYTMTADDSGNTLRVGVTAAIGGWLGEPDYSETTVVIADATVGTPVNTTAPVVSGTATDGETLTVSHGSWTNSPSPYVYQWMACGASGDYVDSCGPIGSDSSTYDLTSSEAGEYIYVIVYAQNMFGFGVSYSNIVGPVGP